MKTPQNFVIWLQGFLDACSQPNEAQVEIIKNKLDDLFEHVAEQLVIKPTKPSLEDLGNQHGFPVESGFPDYSSYNNPSDIRFKC